MLIHEISMKKRKVLDRIYRLVLIVVTILIDVGVFTYAKNSGIEMLIIIGKKKLIMLILENIIIMIGVVLKSNAKEKIRNSRVVVKINKMVLIGCPLIVFIAVQLIISDGIFLVQVDYILENLLIYYAIYICLLVVVRYAKVAISIYCILMSLLSMVNYYITLFRGKAFVVMDIFNIKTAASVSGNYTYDIPIKIGLCLLGIMIALLYQELFQTIEFPYKGKRNVTKRCGVFVTMVLLLYGSKGRYRSEGVYLWNVAEDYINKGFIYKLICELQYIQVQKPQGYSSERASQILAETETKFSENEITKTVPQNLIVIMNESLADFEMLSDFRCSEEILPTMHSLQENTKKGYVYVPSFGGGTSDTEYEVLTGNTKQFLPSGGIAYQLYCNESEYGLTSTLNQLGYETIAVHPFYSNGWNRTRVYQEMGFDEFISLESWGDEYATIRDYISDESTYQKIKMLINSSNEEKKFIFCVTMQNHGGYDGETGLEGKIFLNYTEEYPEAETYFSLIRESDRAFKDLLDYFSNINEPTMIVMYGDHWPNLEEDFFCELYNQDFNDMDMENSMSRYKTPYMIWTNYPSEYSLEDMSTNYFGSYILEQAGLELTGYNKFLLNLKEKIPIIGIEAVCDAAGKWYSMDELPKEYKKLLEQYRIVQYNNVVDRKHRIDEAFEVIGNEHG